MRYIKTMLLFLSLFTLLGCPQAKNRLNPVTESDVIIWDAYADERGATWIEFYAEWNKPVVYARVEWVAQTVEGYTQIKITHEFEIQPPQLPARSVTDMVDNLRPNTWYNIVVTVKDSNGQTYISPTYTYITDGSASKPKNIIKPAFR